MTASSLRQFTPLLLGVIAGFSASLIQAQLTPCPPPSAPITTRAFIA